MHWVPTSSTIGATVSHQTHKDKLITNDSKIFLGYEIPMDLGNVDCKAFDTIAFKSNRCDRDLC